MRIHAIIDFMHIYYKYYFQLKEGKLKHLSAPVDWNGTVINKDTTLIYYPLKDIEGIRRKLESCGHETTISVCFDMPSKRLDIEGGEEYKSGRRKTLTDEDFKNIEFIYGLLLKAGHNAYRYTGYEADDIVNYLVRTYSNSGDFDYTVIYTNDKDLLVNISDKVGAMRFKQYRGYSSVDMSNYEAYLEAEFKTFIPYNMLGLYLASVGDSADKVKGIKGFGAKAFSKLITKLGLSKEQDGIDFKQCGNYDYLQKVIWACGKHLTEEQFEQLKIGFTLVANMEVLEDVDKPVNKSNKQTREQAYLPYNMVSLID